jgi:membrane protease YdiL (CAAX protease family)
MTYGQNLLESLFLLFLAVIGFRALDFVATRGAHRKEMLGLPRRTTAGREWGSGFAVGWGLCLAAVLPALLSGHFHAVLNHGAGVAPGIVAAVATLAVAALAEEVIFRGYAFRRLVKGMGPAWASLVMSVVFAWVLLGGNRPRNLGWALLDAFLFGVLLAMCYLRTHGLWVGWGLHFGYRVMMAVVLGLPIVGRSDFGSLMDGNASGPRWLSGGAFGLDAAGWTAVVMLAGMAVVYRVTKDWAWAYTLPEILPAGYEVVVAPPPAHVAMEKAAAPPPLVQILPVTPQSFSVRDEVGRKE